MDTASSSDWGATSEAPQQQSKTRQDHAADKRSKSSHPVVVEKIVQQPTYVEKIIEVPVIKYVNVPREVIQYVPKVEVKVVEQEVQVPGPIVEVPKSVVKEVEKTVYDYQDTEALTTVACTIEPHIEESKEHRKVVRVKKYVPYMVPVEVFIPVPVTRDLIATGSAERTRTVTMPPSQFNAQVKAANPGLSEQHLTSLYQRYADGSVPMFKGPGTAWVPPKISPPTS